MYRMRLTLIYLLFIYICPIYSLTYNNISNLIVIADVHGDINRFRYILQNENIIDSHNNWKAKENTIVIQLGDQIDPKDRPYSQNDKDHFDMIYYTDFLKKAAKKNKGDFVSLIGNHEHMNLKMIQKNKKLEEIIANRPLLVKINDNIFCHASLKKHHTNIMTKYNMTFSDVNMLWYKYVKKMHLNALDKIMIEILILDEESIIYNKIPDNKKHTYQVLDQYSADYMFVGHLISKHIHVENRIWYLDQLLSKAFNGNIYTYVTIIDNNIKIKALNYYLYIMNLFNYFL